LVNAWLAKIEPLNRATAVALLTDMARDAIRNAMLDLAEGATGEPGVAALAAYAQGLGAEGVWALRGVEDVDVSYYFPGDGDSLSLLVADAKLVFVARFPEGDGGPDGIESY
jgi:hypothetical protein